MLGIINEEFVFEFTDEDGLGKALNHYAEKHGCDTILVVDSTDSIKAVINNGNMLFVNTREDVKYTLYGTACGLYKDLGRGDTLPVKSDWPLAFDSFFYRVQPMPDKINF